jgi:hypothetical protein
VTITRPTVTVEIDFTTDLSAGVAYFEKVAADGPYVWYRLQESAGTSAADASGNGQTGTYAGTYTQNQTSGKPVSGETAARYVNLSTGGRVSFPAPPAGATKVTWEAWVYRSTLDGNAATKYWFMVSHPSGPADSDIYFGAAMQGDGKLYLKGPSTHTSTSVVFSAATWYHVAIVGDQENAAYTFFVNGVAVATTFSPPADQQLVWYHLTGQSTWAWGGYSGATNVVSRIAEPAMYLDALGSSQLLDHYDARATPPFTDYTWTDVTAYIDDSAPLTRRFGSESGTEDITPMEVSYTLKNGTRRFEPEYTGSPYYPNVETGRPTRVRMVQDAVTYDWAFGFIQDFPQVYPDGELVGNVPITAHCQLEKMNGQDMRPRTFRQQLAGTRINTALNISGQPSTRRTIDTGANQIMSQTVESGTAGDHARQVARTDRGRFYFDGAGYAIFQDGTYRTTNSRAINPRGVLGKDFIEYASPEFHEPRALIRNEITLRRPGGVDQKVVNAESRAKYGPKSYTDEILLVDDAAVLARAEDLSDDYSTPSLRVRSVSFTPQQGAGHWDHCLGVKISDRYAWVFEPMTGTPITRQVFVEGVQDVYAFREGAYFATWFLSTTLTGNQVVYPDSARAAAVTPNPGTSGSGTSGPVTATPSAAVAYATTMQPTLLGADSGTVVLVTATQGFTNMGRIVRAAPTAPRPNQKDQTPGVWVYMFSAPPIYNVIVPGSSNQDYRIQAPIQPPTDVRLPVSAVQQR